MAHNSNSDAKSIARAFIETWERNDLKTARTMIADDSMVWLAHTYGVPHGPNPGTSFGLPRWIELLQEAIDRMPKGIRMTIHRMVAEDGWVAVDTESHGDVDNGKLYNMRYTFWFEVRGGKIRTLKQFFDTQYGNSFFLDSMTRA